MAAAAADARPSVAVVQTEYQKPACCLAAAVASAADAPTFACRRQPSVVG